MKKFKGKYLTSSHRLKGFDYGSNAGYFVTLNTKNRIHYFGRIEPNCKSPDLPKIIYSPIGSIANLYWQEIPEHFPFVKLDEFVIMPDHIIRNNDELERIRKYIQMNPVKWLQKYGNVK